MIHSGTSVLVLGLGISGKSAVRYLHGCGARVFASDSRPEEKLSEDEKHLLTKYCCGYEVGSHTEQFLDSADFVFRSPGVPANLEILRSAEKRKIPIIGELALAAPVITSRVIAVTGTNGKTTVATLLGDILKTAGKDVFVGGNIGTPLFESLMLENQPEIAVVEVSSFQLEDAGEFRPDIAILLNITPDHIDWHGSLKKYVQAKAKLFIHQMDEDLAIISDDDLFCKELADKMEKKPLLFGHRKDCGAYICESEIYLKHMGRVEVYNLSGSVFDNATGKLNCAPAIIAARNCGCSKEDIMKGLHSFSPLPHRMEYVDSIDGVAFCNDSKATNTGAVIRALQQAKGKVVLIAGGKDKGEEYQLLREIVRKKVRKLVLIGEASEAIAAQVEDLVDIQFAGSMDEAVAVAGKVALAGDTVLLSPACASFDMFDSYAHRGQLFKEAVMQLKKNTRESGAG